ncbi:hypothetical protein AVEN_202546-1 [Araneus ventricosus]|uniref:Uncharacterized protein n=1 Tax=Araneus ventricosus TaxID=182803 RepID=A0A4Y2IQL1_ARAVE|nr:hypothetical protein AVEN_202546-1 [Araneus ventricosus]
MGSGGLWYGLRFRTWMVRGRIPDYIIDLPCTWTRCMLNLTSWVKRRSADVVRKFGDRVAAQVLSFSFESGSKLRGSSKNNSSIDSKREVNITKISFLFSCYFSYNIL